MSEMPVFTIKAKDILAQPAILAYAELAVSLGLFEHARETHHALNEIRAWQNANRDKVKIPDHTHVPADAAATAAPGEPQDDSDPFGIGAMEPTVGCCSKCGEARTEVYTCRDGGSTVVCRTHGHETGATFMLEGERRCGVPCPIAACGQLLVPALALPTKEDS